MGGDRHGPESKGADTDGERVNGSGWPVQPEPPAIAKASTKILGHGAKLG